MKITLDHRCIVHLANRTQTGSRVERLASGKGNPCFIVNIASAEMRQRGVRPEHYETFAQLLAAARIGHLPRLDPMLVVDATFWGKCVWADAGMARLSRDIGVALFGEAPGLDVPADGIDSPAGRRWLDRHCDVQTLWCHVRNASDVFLTTDAGLRDEPVARRLAALGVGRICLPGEL